MRRFSRSISKCGNNGNLLRHNKNSPNPISGDNLSIGLLLRNSERFWLHFSDEKKTLAKKLLDNKSDFIDYIVKQISSKVDEANKDLANSQTKMFDLSTFLSSDRVSHLNVYCNGLLRFSEPAFLNDVITENKFEKLFQLLIDKTYQKVKPEVDEKDMKKMTIIYQFNFIKLFLK